VPPILRQYLTILGGSAGRLVLSLVYFLIVANGLSLADFGLFATVSATGIVLSRLLAFGFVSPLYRTATVRPRLIGTYLAGFAGLALLSLPVIALVALGLHRLALGNQIAAWPFALILAGEVLGWRLLEIVVIINNGMNRFAKASAIVIAGSCLRTVAALLFLWLGAGSLALWAQLFLAANVAAFAMAAIWGLPRRRWRWRPALYRRRMGDAVTAGAADLSFYLQAELDKVLVLSLAGPRLAGLYAIAMRIIDLTAMPIRAFNQMMIQAVMARRRAGVLGQHGAWHEAGIAAISVTGLAGFVVLLWLLPGILGRNVQDAAPLLLPMLLVPAFRNLVEYHGELLYAREKTLSRLVLLLGLAALKAVLLVALFQTTADPVTMALWLNVVFGAVYLAAVLSSRRLLRNG
jgi:O-antigen/teichoic acid export membrane protein